MAVEVGFGTSKIIREDHIFPIPLIQFTHPILKEIKIKNDQPYSKSGKEQKIIKKQDYQTILECGCYSSFPAMGSEYDAFNSVLKILVTRSHLTRGFP